MEKGTEKSFFTLQVFLWMWACVNIPYECMNWFFLYFKYFFLMMMTVRKRERERANVAFGCAKLCYVIWKKAIIIYSFDFDPSTVKSFSRKKSIYVCCFVSFSLSSTFPNEKRWNENWWWSDVSYRSVCMCLKTHASRFSSWLTDQNISLFFAFWEMNKSLRAHIAHRDASFMRLNCLFVK